MSDLSHLSPSVREVMLRPTEERVLYAQQDDWIGYERARQALQALSDLLAHPRTLRMPNLLLVGDIANGKSTILNRFQEEHPVVVEPTGDALCPVVMMIMPEEPSETRFWSELLKALRISHRETDPVQRKKNQAHSVLRYVRCRMLIIDEIHNVLFGHARLQRQFLGVLKNLTNELKIPIVAAGTRDSIRTLHTDAQLSSRFEAFGLPRWQVDMEYRRVLASFEKLLPLAEPSNLSSKEIAIKVHGMSGGTIGGINRVLKKASVEAIRSKEEKITLPILNRISWVKISDYGKQADQL